MSRKEEQVHDDTNHRPLIVDTEVKHYDLRNALYNRIV